MQTGLIWKANLHYYPPAGSVGQTLHDAYRDAFVIQIEGSTAWRLQPKIDQEEVRSGEEETHTLQPGDTLYVPQGWTAVSVEGGDPGRPSLLLSVVSAAEHLNHGRFIDYMLKMWATASGPDGPINPPSVSEKLTEDGKLRLWLKKTIDNLGDSRGARLRRSLPARTMQTKPTDRTIYADLRETMEAMVPDVRESDDCGSTDCSDLLRGVLGVEEGTWLMLVDHIYGSVVMKLQEGVLNALEEREEKVGWLVKQTKLDWQLRKHTEWDAALEEVEPDELEEEDTGRYVALHMTTPEGDESTRHYMHELGEVLGFLIAEKPEAEEFDGWFKQCASSSDRLCLCSALLLAECVADSSVCWAVVSCARQGGCAGAR